MAAGAIERVLRGAPPHPIVNVLVVGTALACVLTLVKLAAGQGVPPMLSSVVQTGGAGLFLLLWRRRHGFPPLTRAYRRYYLVAGILGLALPNALVFNVAAKAGAGYAGILFALPPTLTYAVAALGGFDRFEGRRAVGVALGLIGALAIVGPAAAAGGTVGLWLVLGLLAPLSLSLGNVYRTVAWPKGANGGALAAGTLLAASPLLALAGAAFGALTPAGPPGAAAYLLLLAEAAVTALAMLVFFDLQRRGGPVYLSLVGYVIAAMSVLLGALVFGELPRPLDLAGMAVIALSLAFARPRGAA